MCISPCLFDFLPLSRHHDVGHRGPYGTVRDIPGHVYVFLQLVAVVCPPFIFLLCEIPDREFRRDFCTSLFLCFLFPLAVVHASVFIYETRALRHKGRLPRFFLEARILSPSFKSPGRRRTLASFSPTNLTPLSPLPGGRPGSFASTTSLPNLPLPVSSHHCAPAPVRVAAMPKFLSDPQPFLDSIYPGRYLPYCPPSLHQSIPGEFTAEEDLEAMDPVLAAALTKAALIPEAAGAPWCACRLCYPRSVV